MEHRMSPDQTNPDTLGWTQFKKDEDLVRKMVTYVECDSVGTGCMEGGPIEPKCTAKIWIRSGVALDMPTVSTTILKHEVRHAVESAANYKNHIEALNRARFWCLPSDCHNIRKDYVAEIYQIYESYDRYLSDSWDARDNPSPVRREEYRSKVKGQHSDINSMLATAAKYQRDLSACMQKHWMASPNDWPRLPKLNKL